MGARMWQLAVRDAAPRAGRFPLVAFSHGFGSHRRQSSFLCTHLASHGYVVVAPDHTGNTVVDLMATATAAASGQRRSPVPLDELLRNRPADVTLAIDHALAAIAGADADRIGVAGHSFGGWTTLALPARDRRVRAALPLAPAGGSSSVADAGSLLAALDFAWGRDVPTLFVVAELDSILPLPSMRVLYDAVASAKQFVVLRNADHMHFCDAVERVHELFRMMPRVEGIPGSKPFPPIAELCPGEHGYATVRGLGLAHFDAHLRGRADAAAWLAGPWRAALESRGIALDVW
jgi:predicted dienelactone hydrolase